MTCWMERLSLMLAIEIAFIQRWSCKLINFKYIYKSSLNDMIFHNPIYTLILFQLRSHAEYLQRLLPTSAVVKAFNVLSAYVLESGGIQGSKEVKNVS